MAGKKKVKKAPLPKHTRHYPVHVEQAAARAVDALDMADKVLRGRIDIRRAQPTPESVVEECLAWAEMRAAIDMAVKVKKLYEGLHVAT